jgi:dTDP-4-dehydrorhamnose 3,5-epimerase
LRFVETDLSGALQILPEPREDTRGIFARTYCKEEFAQHGLDPRFVQCSTSYNHHKDTLRGLHYQCVPFEEEKLVRCTRGAIYDVIVDLRPDSPTRLKSFALELTADNRYALYIPKGFAHGFKTLVDGSEVFYQIAQAYNPAAARGLRWNDPVLNLDWPGGIPHLSERDRSYLDFQP